MLESQMEELFIQHSWSHLWSEWETSLRSCQTSRTTSTVTWARAHGLTPKTTWWFSRGISSGTIYHLPMLWLLQLRRSGPESLRVYLCSHCFASCCQPRTLWDWWRSRSSRLSWNAEGRASQISINFGLLCMWVISANTLSWINTNGTKHCWMHLWWKSASELLRLFWIKCVSERGIFVLFVLNPWSILFIFRLHCVWIILDDAFWEKGYKDCFLTTVWLFFFHDLLQCVFDS